MLLANFTVETRVKNKTSFKRMRFWRAGLYRILFPRLLRRVDILFVSSALSLKTVRRTVLLTLAFESLPAHI